MKRILLVFATAVVAVSCNKLGENEFEISGTVDTTLNGKNIYLEKQDGPMGFAAVDTAIVKDGKFKFEGTVTEPSLRFLSINDPSKKVDLILENGVIEIVVDKDSLQKTVRKGTDNNIKLQEYYNSLTDLQKKAMAFQKNNTVKMMEARQKNDTAAINSLIKQYQDINKEMENKGVTFIKNNPESYVTVLLLKMMTTSGRLSSEDTKSYYNALSAKMKKTKEGKEIAEMVNKQASPVAIGKPAPDFTAPTPTGEKLSLKQSLGKVTIIDFWASWCGPCRRENPNMVALYNEYHPKGLNIVGVSLDRLGDGDKWKQAITTDKLTWPQVSNLMEWNDPIAKQYNVEGIPATFILDAKGNVIARDLRGAELKAKVDELLKN